MLLTVSFVALYLLKLPTVWRPSNHLCFKSCPTELLSRLTERRSILFSGPLSGRKTPIGPLAGHYKNPILPFSLGLNFLLFFRQRFLKQLYTAVYKHIKVPSVSVLQSITLLVFPEPNRNIFWTYSLYEDPGSAR